MIFSAKNSRGKIMREMNGKSRKQLKNKMAKVFSNKIQTLTVEMQSILLDDLVTAFENRLDVLNRAQSNVQCVTDIELKVTYEKIQA
jgi:hypothetical protein